MIETRDTLEYAGRVWMYRALRETVHKETLARIEALLPGGYLYRIEKDPVKGGWQASFGDTHDGSGWGIPHHFRTEEGADVGLLALMVDECIFPGCQTAYQTGRALERERMKKGEAP
jgi:hypothetical protein